MRSHDYNCDHDEVHDYDYLGGSRGVLLAAANAKAQEERDLLEGRGIKARPNPSRLARSTLSTSTPPLSRSTLYLLLTVCSTFTAPLPRSTHSLPSRPPAPPHCVLHIHRCPPPLSSLPPCPSTHTLLTCAPYLFPQTLSPPVRPHPPHRALNIHRSPPTLHPLPPIPTLTTCSKRFSRIGSP